MDTSEQYIKMCDCEEIQELKPAWGEVWHKQFFAYDINGNILWLPRQDQLQDMVDCDKNIQIAHHRLYQIAEFWVGRDLQSMEQLWLAFVMKEKYNKVWSNDKWEVK